MFPRENNLEWLRLVFALQVALTHISNHLELILPPGIQHFPGVPAFFFVSGFLIYASYQNAPGRRYFENRFLRLFPCLLFVTLGGAAVALTARGWSDLLNNLPTYTGWIVAQITLGQAYTPALFRDIGVGVINGALWTLTVEILFYISVPVIAWLEKRFDHTVIVLMCLSFGVFAIGPLIWTENVYRQRTFFHVIELTPLAWGWMFGFGILAVKYFDPLRRNIRLFPLLLLPMAAMMMSGDGIWFGSTANRLGLFYFICYAGLILWFAFALHLMPLRFDLSYGSYVWHMPVINFLLVMNVRSPILALALTAALATISWIFIERPALKLKKKSLKSA